MLQALALAIWAPAGLALRCNHLETTSGALTGASVPESDEHAMRLTHGSAQEPRPDLQQAVLALLGAQDGGVPWGRQRWDGHTSDTQVLQPRAAAWRRAVQAPPTPRSLGAAATLSCADHAVPLAPLGCITRMPAPLKGVAQVMSPALPGDPGQTGAANTRSQPLALGHSGMAQRWRVV